MEVIDKLTNQPNCQGWHQFWFCCPITARGTVQMHPISSVNHDFIFFLTVRRYFPDTKEEQVNRRQLMQSSAFDFSIRTLPLV
jgi:hypothetical protein